MRTLADYAKHDEFCPKYPSWVTTEFICTCGLDTLLAATRRKPETHSQVEEAREKLNTQIQCFADEIQAYGCAVDAKLDPAIDALIEAASLQREPETILEMEKKDAIPSNKQSDEVSTLPE